ncbi:phage tail protein [Deinococcus radiotolerans]|uniref:Tail Collar domain-containing protein n=1 Tax=Deinococcus radiotolerans TaxID=1309407 RepID=A0ABQ2FRM2_9DEIO|nr:tail fiber protein [Deinococcus radiotolerans]GGL19790.1 tail Collar domain-containing protein [Deinococcus radiotolerans]
MEPFLGEIRIFGGNFEPKGWAFCNGQLLPIAQYTALFSLLGTSYGGNGKTNFALPNIQGAAPMGTGAGPGLSPRDLGEQGGQASVTLLQSELPPHTHIISAFDAAGTSAVPTDRNLARSTGGNVYAAGSPTLTLAPTSMGVAGGSQPHNNMPPYLTVNFIIALQGVFPQRP